MVIAQNDIRERLQLFIDEGRVPHALLFCGPEGCGKLAMAFEYAQSLLSVGADERGKLMAASLVHPDLHFTFPVYKPEGQLEGSTSDQFIKQWHALIAETHYFDLSTWIARITKEAKRVQIYAKESESIIHKLNLVSSQGGYKVLIIWLPEMMEAVCANKILKILEEPPQQTVIILVSNKPEQLLDTIVSRCQRIEFKGLSVDEISQTLIETRGLDDDVARFIAHTASGSYLKALQQLSSDDTNEQFLVMFINLMRRCYQRNIKEMRSWSELIAGWGREQQKEFLVYCQRLVRENFMYNFHNPELNYMTHDESDFSVRFARFINERNVIGIMDELSQCQRDIEQNTNSKMVFFDFALKMIVLLIQ